MMYSMIEVQDSNNVRRQQLIHGQRRNNRDDGNRNNNRDRDGDGDGNRDRDSNNSGVEEEESNSDVVEKRDQKPLYHRVIGYMRQAWTGVKFALDSELEDLETPPRSRPDSLESLCKNTKFSQQEIKRIYRGFKAECPTGVIKEDNFKLIYSQFFPQGANTSYYAHYVFNTLDHDKSGIINFENFLQCLSVLSRGTMDEKMRWIFSLYDINGDGCISRDEMTDIVSAIYNLMGKQSNPSVDDFTIKERVEIIFSKMDKNRDGVVTFDEFLECCKRDECISSSINVFDSSIV